MMPEIKKIDHVHIYVSERDVAEDWYRDVLGFKRVEALDIWATKEGPRTMESLNGNVHIALFERQDFEPDTTIAFGASAADLLDWKAHLESQGLKLRLTDHTLAFSIYFYDPWNNMHEITTYERDEVVAALENS